MCFVASSSTAAGKCFKVEATIAGCRIRSGFRKLVYERASLCHAIYNVPEYESIWYKENSDDLGIILMFKSETDALRFICWLSELKASPQMYDNVLFVEEPDVNDLPLSTRHVFVSHYNKGDSTSPTNSRADTLSQCSEIPNDMDPHKAFRSVEDLSKLAKGDVLYKCHIAPKAFFTDYIHDLDNIIHASHLFHNYFDGDGKRRPWGKPASWGRPPELWIQYLSAGGREMFSGVSYYQINVCIHFRDPEMARFMESTFRPGTIVDGDLRFITWFYSSNAANTEMYLGLKKRETQNRWKVADDMVTEVEDDEEGAAMHSEDGDGVNDS